jgi:hypothetical protein
MPDRSDGMRGYRDRVVGTLEDRQLVRDAASAQPGDRQADDERVRKLQSSTGQCTGKSLAVSDRSSAVMAAVCQ